MSPATDTLPARATAVHPYTGGEYLASLRDDREIWIYGERVADVTTHPAFRNSARSVARLYEALHDPAHHGVLSVPTDTGNGGFTHPFFKVPKSRQDLSTARDAITVWQELVFGWMGRTPDYKASLFACLGANPGHFGEFESNARRWYTEAQERVMFFGHAIVNPPVDRTRLAEDIDDIVVHVDEETDSGLIVSGAKVVATGSPLTHAVLVGHYGPRLTKRDYALLFIAPTNGPGVKFLARGSYESVAARTGSPFDYPLSSRFDENDSIIVFDRALIPWENVLIWDPERLHTFMHDSGWVARAALQSGTRMKVKLEFLAGLLSMAIDIKGTNDLRAAQVALGEVMAWRSAVAAMVDGMIESTRPGFGGMLTPDAGYGTSFAALSQILYRRVKEVVEIIAASGLIYLNSNAVDFGQPEIRPYLDRYLRGSNGTSAIERSKVMKLLWDAIGSEFGGRHELYEMNYLASAEVNFFKTFNTIAANGELDRVRALATTCMADYDLNGWTAPDLIAPLDVSHIRATHIRSVAGKGRS